MSVHTSIGGGPTFPGLDGRGGGVPTFPGGGLPTFPGLDCGVPTLTGGTYLGRRGVPTFPGRNSIACACYVVGGMPLAFKAGGLSC